MSDGIHFRRSDIREIVRVFAEVSLVCGLAFGALSTIMLVTMLTWPAIPMTGGAVIAALVIRGIVRWVNNRDDPAPPAAPDELSGAPVRSGGPTG